MTLLVQPNPLLSRDGGKLIQYLMLFNTLCVHLNHLIIIHHALVKLMETFNKDSTAWHCIVLGHLFPRGQQRRH